MNNIGSFPILPMSVQSAQNSNGSLSSYTSKLTVWAMADHVTTHDRKDKVKSLGNASTGYAGTN